MTAVSAHESLALAQAAAQQAHEVLTFRLGAEEYSMDILRVQEIRSYEEPTRMVGTPPFIKGVMNLRGIIVPIVDLRLKFHITGLGTLTDGEQQRMVIMQDIEALMRSPAMALGEEDTVSA